MSQRGSQCQGQCSAPRPPPLCLPWKPSSDPDKIWCLSSVLSPFHFQLGANQLVSPMTEVMQMDMQPVSGVCAVNKLSCNLHFHCVQLYSTRVAHTCRICLQKRCGQHLRCQSISPPSFICIGRSSVSDQSWTPLLINSDVSAVLPRCQA